MEENYDGKKQSAVLHIKPWINPFREGSGLGWEGGERAAVFYIKPWMNPFQEDRGLGWGGGGRKAKGLRRSRVTQLFSHCLAAPAPVLFLWQNTTQL